jgi:hypothetical protein
MGSIDWDEVGEALIRSVQADRIKDYIKEPLEEIIAPLLKGEKILPPESIDVIMPLIFVHINLLGYLSTGSDTSAVAVEFLRKYFGRIDARYKEVGGLLYHMLRHGWIHRFTPKRLKLNDGTILDFQYSFDKNREQHLSKIVEIQGAKTLHISLSLLYYDLLSALDLFAENIRSNEDLSNIFKKAFETRRKPEKEGELRRRNYIKSSDFDFIYRLLAG